MAKGSKMKTGKSHAVRCARYLRKPFVRKCVLHWCIARPLCLKALGERDPTKQTVGKEYVLVHIKNWCSFNYERGWPASSFAPQRGRMKLEMMLTCLQVCLGHHAPFDLILGVPKISFWAPSAPGGKHFTKIGPGIWNSAWNYETMKAAPGNSVQTPGLEIFRSLLCLRKRAFSFTVIYIFLHVVPKWLGLIW